MEEVKYYINKVINSRLYHTKPQDEINARNCVSDIIWRKLKEINEDLDISVTLQFSEHNNRLMIVLHGIVIGIGMVGNKIIYKKDSPVQVKGKIQDWEKYIECVNITVQQVNNEIAEYYKTFETSGELILVEADLYNIFFQYLKYYDLSDIIIFSYYENLLYEKIDECLRKAGIKVSYVLPASFDYICAIDELPPIQIEKVDNIPVRMYNITYDVSLHQSEFTLLAQGVDRDKLYFVVMIVNIFEAARMNYIWRNLSKNNQEIK